MVAGAVSDHIEFDLVSGGLSQVLRSGDLKETGSLELASFRIPQTVISFVESGTSISDILVIDPTTIRISSDDEKPLKPIKGVRFTGEKGAIFTINAVSDVEIAEPVNVFVFGTALAGLALLHRRPRRMLIE